MCSYTVTLHIRKNTQKSKFLLSQAFKWKKNMFFVIPEMPSKTFAMVKKNFLVTLTRWCLTKDWAPKACIPHFVPFLISWRHLFKSKCAKPAFSQSFGSVIKKGYTYI